MMRRDRSSSSFFVQKGEEEINTSDVLKEKERNYII